MSERTNATGALGLYLKGLLRSEWVAATRKLPFHEQISAVYTPTYLGKPVSDLERAAAAFLVPDFPVQVRLSEASLLILIGNTLPLKYDRGGNDYRWTTSIQKTVGYFKVKGCAAATNKVNLWLNEVFRDLRSVSPMSAIAAADALWPYRGILHNDQASGVVLYGTGLAGCGVPDAYRVAAALVANEPVAKALTTFIKAVGANGSRLGAALVEANCVMGRGVGGIDLLAEATYRTTDAVGEKLAIFDEATLRAACRALLEEEISRTDAGYAIDYGTLEEHWDSRWAWAVNGAHSGLVSKEYSRAVPRPPGMLREHRRAWLETVEQDPRPSWDGHTYVSVSPKLESGKTRAIFACDTVNYLAFEHLLGPVERRWRHSRVVLDPGKGGHTGMAFKTRAARSRSGVSMMLDYDDFNSQHSNMAMKVLVDELCSLTGYPRHLADTLICSFDKCDIYLGADLVGRSRGTLMSGHRGTTFINSCLNKVYLDIVLGDETMRHCTSIHVGDDVYLGVKTYRQAGEVAATLSSSSLRMNPIKQSVGHVSTEFLRNASSGRSTRAYLARGVAGVVAGNWISEMVLSPSEAITAMIAAGRTLANRSGVDVLPLLLFSGVCRMSGLPKEDHKKLRELLCGTTALDNGPQFHQGGYYRSIKLHVGISARDRHGYAPLPRAAVNAYLSRAAQPLEVEILNQAGVSVVGAMEEASFRKSLPARYQNYETVRLGGVTLTSAVGSESVANLVNVPAPVGVLQRYPLLTLARNRLPEHLVRLAVREAGGNPSATDLEYEAWGEFKHGCIVATPMSYSDAAMFGHRTLATVLVSPVDVWV